MRKNHRQQSDPATIDTSTSINAALDIGDVDYSIPVDEDTSEEADVSDGQQREDDGHVDVVILTEDAHEDEVHDLPELQAPDDSDNEENDDDLDDQEFMAFLDDIVDPTANSERLRCFDGPNKFTPAFVRSEIDASAYVPYLKNSCGKSVRRLATMLTRITTVLAYCIKSLVGRARFDTLADAVTDIINTHYALLEPCARYLLVNRHLSAGTVCDYLMDAQCYFEWFALFSPENTSVTNNDLPRITHICKQLQRRYRTQVCSNAE